MRKIIRTKSFVNQLKNWQKYKIVSEEDLQHYISKLRIITEIICTISCQPKFIGRNVNYRTSKNVYYFPYQQHVIFLNWKKKN
jgi:hypothetical protein